MYKHVIPPRAVPRNDDRYFEVLSQSVFQAGFSWEVVRQKWPAIRRAFANFEIDTVAGFRLRDVERLMRNAGIVRNRRKVEAVIENARILQELQREHGSVKRCIRSLPKSYAQRVKILSRTFRFLGPTGVFHFLWCVGEDVPSWHDRDPARRRG